MAWAQPLGSFRGGDADTNGAIACAPGCISYVHELRDLAGAMELEIDLRRSRRRPRRPRRKSL